MAEGSLYRVILPLHLTHTRNSCTVLYYSAALHWCQCLLPDSLCRVWHTSQWGERHWRGGQGAGFGTGAHHSSCQHLLEAHHVPVVVSPHAFLLECGFWFQVRALNAVPCGSLLINNEALIHKQRAAQGRRGPPVNTAGKVNFY
jgi:hypothetical protein